MVLLNNILIIILIFFKIIVTSLFFTILIAATTLYERKLLSLVQQRVGPLYVGYRGRLQFFADSIKLLSKGIIILFTIFNKEFIIFSIFSIFFVYILWPNIYLGYSCLIIDIEYNILYLVFSSLFLIYSIVNIGLISKNKFVLIAILRFILVTINNELVLGFLLSFIILSLESVSFSMVSNVFFNNYYLFALFPIILILLICFCIEVGRTPFDFGESESELVAGYVTELSGFIFVLFYLGEYFHLVVFSNIYSIFFFL